MEIWHEIPEYTGLYEASSHGRIRSVEDKITSSARFKKRVWKQRIIKQKEKKTKNGRVDYMVTFWKDGKPHYHLVARLIASTFFGVPLNSKLTVNHKDGNPKNNNKSNLEWLSRIDNIKYGFEHHQYDNTRKPITAINKNDELDTLFAESYADMDRQLNQYRGYTSRMVSLKREKLYSKSGKIYTITPF